MLDESHADLYLRISHDHPGATSIKRQEFDCRNWCERNGLTVRKVHADGNWIGGRPPYGTYVSDGKLYTDPDTAANVREIARRALAGESLIRIARWLNGNGVAAPRGGPWGAGSVRQLLVSPTSAGLLPETIKRGGKYTSTVRPWIDPGSGRPVEVMGEGERPLISVDDQHRILLRLAGQRRYGVPARRPGNADDEQPRHFLTGLLRCTGCGARMSVSGNSYRCQSVRTGRLCPEAAGALTSALENAVVDAWRQAIGSGVGHDALNQIVRDRLGGAPPPGSLRSASPSLG
ncbi:recombinase family protein [Actinoplanes sp. NPDC051475]|uniref:recombinase family protein n=1 Tax=Actinoplanes sp. NPDC051475 TaxID=3157225 RepID=UPI00344FEEF2